MTTNPKVLQIAKAMLIAGAANGWKIPVDASVRIELPEGKGHVVIGPRSLESSVPAGTVKSVSSTEPQSFAMINFNAEGVPIGGRTMAASVVATQITKALEAGWQIQDAQLAP